MIDDDLGRRLAGLAPDPAPGYWARIDAALVQAAADRTPTAPRLEQPRGHDPENTVPRPPSHEQPSRERFGPDGRHRSRILLVAAAILLALMAAAGLLAALPDANPIATSPETTATTAPPTIPTRTR